jgi:virginiamycin A acetyltransferase
MNSLAKRVIKKLFQILGIRVSRAGKSSARPNIIESFTRFPELIHGSATVQYSEFRGKINIGAGCMINKVLFDGTISIGRNTTINGPGTEFYAIQHPITVGNFCSIARGTGIQENNHNLKSITTYFIKFRIFNEPYGSDVVSKGPINIGHDVWIGTQCVILSGVTIGNGAVVAANSVVIEDVPPYAIVGGSPARVLSYRFSEDIISRLQQLEWWNWPTEKIIDHYDLFHQNLTLEMLNKIIEREAIQNDVNQVNA